jgi:hypothetical protein
MPMGDARPLPPAVQVECCLSEQVFLNYSVPILLPASSHPRHRSLGDFYLIFS